MRIALAQINTTVGAIAANAAKAAGAIDRARAAGADLVVLPELTLTGYPPKDLLELPAFVETNLRALDGLAARTSRPGSPGVIVGYVERREGRPGKGLHNAAALIQGGRVLSRHFKSLLPTYDVFDEARHFDPAPSVQLADFEGHRLAITICEDFWNDRLYWRRRIYSTDPVETLAAQRPDLMITISASPYAVGKPRIRAEMYSRATRRYGVPLVHVNLVGGNDNLVFDGRSNVWGADGRLLAEAPAFAEDFLVVDVDAGTTGRRPFDATLAPEGSEAEAGEIYAALALGVRDYVGKCGFKRVIVGLSGGIDSSLTATIAADALGPAAVVGVAMPSPFSSAHSLEDAGRLARNLGIEYHVLPITPVYEAFLKTLEPLFAGSGFGLAEENLQARIRGNLLMTLSNKFGLLVLTTGNKSELAVGYCTLYGDMSGGLAVLSDISKTKVYALARWANQAGERIPRRSLEKPPSAELRPDQLDTDSLPPYPTLDPIIEAYVERHLSAGEIIAGGGEAATVRRVLGMIDRNEYKRQQAAIGLKVTGRAFGSGWRMPIARGTWA